MCSRCGEDAARPDTVMALLMYVSRKFRKECASLAKASWRITLSHTCEETTVDPTFLASRCRRVDVMDAPKTKCWERIRRIERIVQPATSRPAAAHRQFFFFFRAVLGLLGGSAIRPIGLIRSQPFVLGPYSGRKKPRRSILLARFQKLSYYARSGTAATYSTQGKTLMTASCYSTSTRRLVPVAVVRPGVLRLGATIMGDFARGRAP